MKDSGEYFGDTKGEGDVQEDLYIGFEMEQNFLFCFMA